MSTVPEINDAKTLAYKYRRTGVVVLHFAGGQFGASSFGMTRKQCDAMRKVTDQICDMIEDGIIEIPDCLTGGIEVAPPSKDKVTP